ncbi:hypothetical protein pipiens_014944 [Culex pipiens pipiens]|uniref:Uncharacterized protein n=1 Tax=Culex pipiens pipiens TaxID=38569 RepID=A0ABD1CSG0_CULPP
MESVERKDQDLERNDSGGKNRSESGSLQVVRVSEFHEVIDSAAVLLQVLGAHDSTEARSMFIEGFLKKENFQDEDDGNFNVDDAFKKANVSQGPKQGLGSNFYETHNAKNWNCIKNTKCFSIKKKKLNENQRTRAQPPIPSVGIKLSNLARDTPLTKQPLEKEKQSPLRSASLQPARHGVAARWY